MTWEIQLVKWKQKRAKRAKEKELKRRQKKDLKDVMRQLYRRINFLPEGNFHFIYCNFPETAEKLKAKGFDVEFRTEFNCLYWYKVGWKE
jgi:hypothetical protein